MSAKAWAALTIVAVASGWLGVGSRRAVAGDEKVRLRWAIAEETLRYELNEDRGRRAGPDTGSTPILDPIRALVTADLDADHRRLRREVRDLSDLVWFVALSLPDLEVGASGAKASFEERWKLARPQGELVAKGTEEASRRDHTVTIRTVLQVTQENLATDVNPPARPWLGATTLTVERTWSAIRKHVVEARFDLATTRLEGDRSLAFELHGRIAPAMSRDALAEVHAAIKRGATFTEEGLKRRLAEIATQQPPPSNALGLVALPTFALLRSGVPVARLGAAFDYMSKADLKEVYSVALYLLCLDARAARRIEVPPTPAGHTVARFAVEAASSAEQKEILRGARWLAGARAKGRGAWSYQGAVERRGTQTKTPKTGPATPPENQPFDKSGKPTDACDRSNSQFAVLALHVASIRGAAIEPEVWREIIEEAIASQEPDGPWRGLRGSIEWNGAAPPGVVPDLGVDPFRPHGTRSKEERERDDGEATRARGWAYAMWGKPKPGEAYGITAAGVSSLVIAREALRRAGKLDAELAERSRRSIVDGISWLIPLSWEHDPKHWAYYYGFYSVEKAMEVAGIEKMCGRDWWTSGVARLLDLEDAPRKGSWQSGNVEDTSLALLFLNRATLPATVVALDAIRSASGDRDPQAWDQVFVEGTGHIRMKQVLYVLESTASDASLAVAEKGLALLDEDIRPRLVPDLIRVLQSSSANARAFASASLKATCGTDDELPARLFARRWEELALVAHSVDHVATPSVRAMLRDTKAPLALRREACLVLDRLLAVEAIDDLVDLLPGKETSLRRAAATAIAHLAPLAPRCDPGASEEVLAPAIDKLREWLVKAREDLFAEADARRRVRTLAHDASAADALRKLGPRAIKPLASEGLTNPATRNAAHALLKELTGQSLPAEPGPWLEWWEKHR